jgi:uncharacterized protein YoxC
MSGEVNTIKNMVADVLEFVNGLKDDLPGNQLNDLRTRLQFVRNTVIENERKIWLRTKKGKELISDLNGRTERLLESVKEKQVSTNFENILQEMEEKAKEIVEEIRKRSMVVT